MERPAKMEKKFKLKIELVPSSAWQSNLRGLLKPVMWDAIRKKVYAKNKNRCSICDSGGRLHAHEVWEYNDQEHIQILSDIIPLCYLCHGVKHIGFSSMEGPENAEKFVKHFMKINNCGRSEYQEHLKEEMEIFNERSRYEWQLDLTKLKDFE